MKILRNAPQVMDGRDLLAKLPSGSASMVVLDPQYRANLDRLKYGNEGERQAQRAALKQMDTVVICEFFNEIDRIIKPKGHVLLWMDKFTLVMGLWKPWMHDLSINPVDLITWDKCRIGMGYRSRQRGEFLLILQKPPLRAKGAWKDRSIDDVWTEQSDREVHPHAKPIALTRRLIMALTKRDDLVVDPAAGGYGVLTICRATGREFVGCDVKKFDDARTNGS